MSSSDIMTSHFMFLRCHDYTLITNKRLRHQGSERLAWTGRFVGHMTIICKWKQRDLTVVSHFSTDKLLQLYNDHTSYIQIYILMHRQIVVVHMQNKFVLQVMYRFLSYWDDEFEFRLGSVCLYKVLCSVL